MRRERVLALVAVFVVAPVFAVVLICALLLFGVEPRLVFLPGHGLRAGLAALGVRTPNVMGVLTTVICWWLLIVGVWLLIRRRRNHVHQPVE